MGDLKSSRSAKWPGVWRWSGKATGTPRSICVSPERSVSCVGRRDAVVLVWDVPALLGASKPPADDREWNVSFSTLSGGDSAVAQQTVWRLAATPEQTLPRVRQQWRHLWADAEAAGANVSNLSATLRRPVSLLGGSRKSAARTRGGGCFSAKAGERENVPGGTPPHREAAHGSQGDGREAPKNCLRFVCAN